MFQFVLHQSELIVVSGKPSRKELAKKPVRKNKAILARLGKIGIVLMMRLIPEIVFVLDRNSTVESCL